MEENKDRQNRILKNSVKITIYTTIILVVTLKTASFLSRPSQSHGQEIKGNTKKTDDTDTSAVVRRRPSKEDSIRILTEELNRAQQLAKKDTTSNNDTQHNSRDSANTAVHIKPAKTHKLKSNDQKKVRKSSLGGGAQVKDEKAADPEQKSNGSIPKSTEGEKKSSNPSQKPSDLVEKTADQGQKISDKPVLEIELKNPLPNKNEIKMSSSNKNVEFIDKSGRVTINSNTLEDGNVIRVREKASENSEMLGLFSILAGNKGYLKFIGKSKEKSETADGKKSFWYEVKIGDRTGYVFGYNLTEK